MALMEKISSIQDLGILVRRKRIQKDWTLRQASEATGTSVTALSHLENGINLPGPDRLKKICETFSIGFPAALEVLRKLKNDRLNNRLKAI